MIGRREQGFTLVELMVVIVIIGLMSGAVILTMGDPRGRLSDEADRFAGRVHAARNRAVIGARPVAIWVSTTGYGFEERRQGEWVPIAERPLDGADWRGGVRAVTSDGARARISFDTIGRAEQPLSFALERDGQSLPIAIDLDGRAGHAR